MCIVYVYICIYIYIYICVYITDFEVAFKRPLKVCGIYACMYVSMHVIHTIQL